MTPKPVSSVRVALHETFDGPRWSGAWLHCGEPNLGIRMAVENGSLSIKTLQKAAQDAGGKMPTPGAEGIRKAILGAASMANVSKKEWPRSAWLETRQAFPFTNEVPLKIRARVWNSHSDPDRITWVAVNKGVAGQGLSVERRGDSIQLWVEGATQPVFKKDAAAVQEWETLELWLSRDQMVVRRNEETLFTGASPLKVRAGSVSVGVNSKVQLAQDEEVRFDDVDLLLTTRAEFEEVSR